MRYGEGVIQGCMWAETKEIEEVGVTVAKKKRTFDERLQGRDKGSYCYMKPAEK